MIIRKETIYFFGGFLSLPEINLQPNVIGLFNVSWYNTITGMFYPKVNLTALLLISLFLTVDVDQWGMDVGSGTGNPTPRKYHTATLSKCTPQLLELLELVLTVIYLVSRRIIKSTNLRWDQRCKPPR
jgi:hypothetical protein